MTVCERFLAREKQTLSKYAFFTSDTRGREKSCTPCPNRTDFQRDRDRIIHSKAFRRLTHKTQVFIFPADEHYRTRMTHTLEVTQIARIIARALMLNEDLTEAAALGHDLGHTPFGHTGEAVMQQCYSADFTHYQQSVRVVEKLENNGEGLNLTWEVRDAILNHTGENLASTLEGRIIKFADRIAYVNHDIDDSFRAGILKPEDIPSDISQILGNTQSERINCMVSAVIDASTDKNEICMEKNVLDAMMKMRAFLFERVYYNPAAKTEEVKAMNLLAKLYEYFVRYPHKMPELFVKIADEESVERAVCDYVSGMTDRYAIELYNELFIPRVWR